jgi:hypothetical protein
LVIQDEGTKLFGGSRRINFTGAGVVATNTGPDITVTIAGGGGGGGGGGDALVANPLSQFATTTSAQLAGVLSDETGTGALVFGTSPNIITPTGIVKGDVGLGSVDNTTDTAKPVSTAQQAALDAKANLASPTFTGTVGGITKAMVGLGDVDNTSNSTERAATATLTNKRVNPRIGTVASSATPTINTDNVDVFSITAQAVNITSMTTNLTGTPVEGQKLLISIKGTASREIIWGASFVGGQFVLPLTTNGTNVSDMLFFWSETLSQWRLIATTEPTLASSGGDNRKIQFNDNGLLGGATTVEIDTAGNLVFNSQDTKPAVPPANTIQLYARRRAGSDWLDFQRPSGRDISFQPHFGVNRIATWSPNLTATVIVSGMPRTVVGTVVHPVLAPTNLSTSARRWRVTSAATENSVSEERAPITLCWRGNDPGLGGWTYTNRISLTTVPALSRWFFGMLATTGALSTTKDPTELTNMVGFGFTQGTDTNWQVYHNDASGTVTKIDMGASFPVSSLTNLYTFYIHSAPNGSSIWVRAVEEVSGAVFEQEITTDIPANTVFLSVRNYANNGGTAAAVAYDCSGVYLETDY